MQAEDQPSENAETEIRTFLYALSALQYESFNCKVRGMTVLDDELFVLLENGVFKTYDRTTMELIDSTMLGAGLLHDITSSSHHKQLYLTDPTNRFILKCTPKTKKMSVIILKQGVPLGISLTKAHKLLIVIAEGFLLETDPDMKEYRTINLDSTIIGPMKAIEIKKNLYAVGHGGSDHPLNRVCLVNGAGKIQRSYGAEPGEDDGELNMPLSLAFDEHNDIIYVADGCNERIVVLSSDLKLLGYLALPGMANFTDITEVYFDPLARSLFICDGRLLLEVSIPRDKNPKKYVTQASVKSAESGTRRPSETSKQSSVISSKEKTTIATKQSPPEASKQVPIVAPKSSCCIII